MRRPTRSGLAGFALLAAAVIGTSACTASNVQFFVKDGLCYRKTVHQTAGCTTDTAVTKAFQTNCGLPADPTESHG